MPQVELSSSQYVKDRKLCPLPVASFTGRDEILKKMHQYFNSEGEFQHVFVLYGLGGSGKSQLAFKFLEESQVNKRYDELLVYDDLPLKHRFSASRMCSTLTLPIDKHSKWTLGPSLLVTLSSR